MRKYIFPSIIVVLILSCSTATVPAGKVEETVAASQFASEAAVNPTLVPPTAASIPTVAPKFLQFIKQELIPVIEKEFPADPKKRVVAGHSLGGLFTAYALFTEPTLFETFLVCSPSLDMHDRLILKLEKQYAKRHKRLAAKVYLSIGELEENPRNKMVRDFVQLATILESRKHKGLTLRRQIFLDLNHCEVVAPGFQAGIKFALKKE